MAEQLTIGSDDDGRRLDRILRKHLQGLPLSAIHRLLRTGSITLDGKKARADTRVTRGAILCLPSIDGVSGPQGRKTEPPRGLPPLDIILENTDLIVVNKAEGVLTHGPNSLEDQILAHLAGKLPPSLSFRPGPLHRLDRQTTGIVTFSASLDGAKRFSEALRERRFSKHYLAILDGKLSSSEEWNDELVRDTDAHKSQVAHDGEDDSVSARTEARPLYASGRYTLALITLGTGRTHQIRVQAAAHGHPLSGDRKYGGSELGEPYLLHAYLFEVPADAGVPLPQCLEAPVPRRFLSAIARLFSLEVCEKLKKVAPADLLAGAIL